MPKTICIAGKNEIAVTGLKLAVESFGKNSVCVCLNQSDAGRTTWQPSLKRFAEECGVAIKPLSQLYDSEDLIFLSLEFDQIIVPNKFRSKSLFNIHFSLLPAYKGMFTAVWPILNNEKFGGVTLHVIDSGIDTGDIIAQRKFELSQGMTSEMLYRQTMEEGIQLLHAQFDDLVNGSFEAKAQQSTGATYYSKNSINFADLELSFNCTAYQANLRHRALFFPVYQVPKFQGRDIFQVEITDTRSQKKAGTVVETGADHCQVATIDFNVILRFDHSSEIFRLCKTGDVNNLAAIPNIDRWINTIDSNGHSPLMISVFHGHLETCEYLIDKGADVNGKNPNGTTVLMFGKDHALKSRDYRILERLMRSGASVLSTDRFGKSVLDYLVNQTREANSREVYDILKAGIQSNAIENSNRDSYQ